MNNEFQIKNIIFYSIFLLLTIILLDMYFKPEINIKFDFLHNLAKKITISQNIAPQRLFINVWRITKNSYVDETLNNQDWLRWRTRYVKHIRTIDDANIAINTMLASLNDPYTKFMKSELFSKEKMMLDSKITGVGVLFNKSGDEIVINHVLDNSPAQAQNINAGDTIVEINGKKASELDMEEVLKSIEGGKEDTVELKIKHNDETITKVLKKQDIPIKTMDYRIIQDNIGVITLANIMGEKAVQDFQNILISTKDTDGIIIDLRNNYGGILANAVQMANYFLDEKEIFSINSRVNAKYHIYSDDEIIFNEKPIVILVNNKTASAAEILAGTLRDNLNAVIIGEHSYGKNSIQQVIPMQNSTGLIITTDKYLLPKGQDIHKTGIIPDIEISQKGIKTFNEDEQMQKAIEIITRLMKNQE
ncbi:PDZ domain-containing protein [bacterium]|nr:PDZ domain-containing protein [bacterium]